MTPTVNDSGASHVIKLNGAVDSDGVIPLSVGSNVITIEVTAEENNNTRTYNVTVTRAELSSSQTLEQRMLDLYDANDNGMFERNEVIAAINDYLFGEQGVITRSDVMWLINSYLHG